jgi:hypothetical protein
MGFFQSVLNIQQKNLKHKIDELDKILKIKNKNLVFIGTIGVGKTSAICSLFNLFDNSDKKKRPILKTGAGATTICEVEIEFGDTHSIKIDAYRIDELKQLFSEYLDTIIGNTTLVDGQIQQLTTELERAIKYMIAPEKTPLIEIDNYINGIIQKYNGDRNQILSNFFKNAGLDERTKVEFSNTESKNNSEWLRATFSDINDGKNKFASIPKKFYITVPSDKNLKNKIIDTKGIDSKNQNNKEFLREDLDRYIKNPDNLIIYCSSFTGAPDSDILQSISYYAQKDPEIYKRMILLVIPKHDEPEHVAGVDPTLDIPEYQQGLEIRKATVKTQLIGQLKNDIYTLCHNSSLSDYRVRFNNLEKSIFSYQDQLINSLESEKTILTSKLNDLIDSIPTPENLALEQKIISNISKLKNDLSVLKINSRGFTAEYSEQYRLRYSAANTKNAIHVRFGIFNTKNVYFDFEVHIEEIITSFFNSANILALLQHELGINQQIIQEIIPSIYENFHNKSLELSATLTKELRSDFENNAYNYAFWSPMISRWGGGPGYNIDVKARLLNQMNQLGIEHKISEEFSGKWNNLVNEIIAELR